MIRIMTDNGSDLTKEFADKYNIHMFSCDVSDGENVYTYEDQIPVEEIYDGMREGKVYTTSQVSMMKMQEEFEKCAVEGASCIYITLGSAVSGTYNSALISKKEVLEKYPEVDITIVDSRSASWGQAALVIKAIKMAEEGKSAEEIADLVKVERDKQKIIFAVGELDYLHRGGRLSGMAKNIGSLLGIKPLLSLDKAGTLVQIDKPRGSRNMKRKIWEWADKMSTSGKLEADQNIYIGHGDWTDEFEELYQQLVEKTQGQANIFKIRIGPVIGAHTGPELFLMVFDGELGPYSKINIENV